jgi:hypothetical protein
MTEGQAQQKQYEIANDVPFEVILNGKKYKCHYLKEWVAGKISYLIAQREPNPNADAQEMIRLMAKNNTIASKCVALMILEKPWKVKLFYPWFWRRLYKTCATRELTTALATVYEALDLSFFLQSMMLVSEMNILKKKLTKIELKQLSAELQSERNLPL